MSADYQAFLERKICLSEQIGFDVTPEEVNHLLKPHQVAAVLWAVRGGRRALFEAFGLGKTLQQLEIVRLVRDRAGGRALIVIPLGIRQEFFRDAAMLGTKVEFIRRIEEASAEGIYLTNYETVRDGKLDPREFTVASLDEASVLRGFGGTKTFREFMRLFAGQDGPRGPRSNGVRYRFVATATPSPNEYIELLSYAAYLDVMDVSAAKTRFFKRDATRADHLTIHPHKEREFWLWMASWALFLQKPSDLDPAFSDEGYDLPPLDVRWHEVSIDHRGAGHERDGQGKMFRNAAIGVQDAAREKRDSLTTRVAALMEIIGGCRGETKVQQGVLPEESDRSTRETAGAQPQELPEESGALRSERSEETASSVRDNAAGMAGHAGRARRRLRDLRRDDPERETPDSSGRRSLPHDGEGARDPLQSLQHGARALRRGSGAAHGSSGIPDQIVLWCDLNDEQRSIERALAAAGITCSSLDGSLDIDERERLIESWRSLETTVFLSKPVMYGAGVNLQQSHTMIFAGIGFKAQDFLQAIHRIHRFLQVHACTVHIIYTEAEREVRHQLERKWTQHRELVEKMTEIIREYGLGHAAMASTLSRSLGVERREISGQSYRLVNADAIEEMRRVESDSVGLIVTSIPFSTQYEYTPSYNDLGHTDSDAHFFEHLDFLTPELLRVLKPGRVAAVHVKDRIVPGGLTGLGFQTISPFSDYTIAHFRKHGFAFLARKTVVTDVVRENNQTYRLGWTEQCKDGSRMGCGLPEYVLLFRKPPTDSSNGYADEPVVKSKERYTRSRWQIDAHGFMRSNGDRFVRPEEIADLPHEKIYKLFRDRGLVNVYDFEEHVRLGEALERKERLPVTFMLLPPPSWHPDVWTDIARMRTLNGAQAAAGREMHLCPLQFDIVDRLIVQLSQEGDLVADPFGGLMTVPYCAIRLRRRGLGIELNAQYFGDGAAYCAAAERKMATPTLFDLDRAVAPASEGA